MQRSAWDRLVAVACALWLVVVLSEPAALHTCAEHDATHGVHVSRPAEHVAGSHAAHSHEAPAKRQHGCSCIGACCVAVAAVLSPRADILVATTSSSPERRIVSIASDYRPSAIEYARPPTIGPPITAA